MSAQKYDNVYSTEVTKDYVNIRAGFCDEEVLKKDKIVDKDVKNIKKLHLSSSDYKTFMNIVVAAGAELQKEYGIDLGFEFKEEVK